MTPSILWRALTVSCALSACAASANVGADMPWTTYEAEGMKTTGVVLGPKYDPNVVETESSGQKCVNLAATGEYVESTAEAKATALLVRYSLPEAGEGVGTRAGLD